MGATAVTCVTLLNVVVEALKSTPEFTTNVRLIPDLNIVVDTPVVLQSVAIEDTYEGDFDTRRALIYNLQLYDTVEVNFENYRINTITTNLANGKSNIELINVV